MLESLDKTCCIQYNGIAFSIIPGVSVEIVVSEEHVSDPSISACSTLVARSPMPGRCLTRYVVLAHPLNKVTLSSKENRHA